MGENATKEGGWPMCSINQTRTDGGTKDAQNRHEIARKRHGYYMVSTRFFALENPQPPPPPTLAPAEKVCFSTGRRICQTNPPCTVSSPPCLRAYVHLADLPNEPTARSASS